MTNNNENKICLPVLLTKAPDGVARVVGGKEYPCLCGTVRFYKTDCGAIVASEINGLPKKGVFAFHIHEGSGCCDEFEHTGSHYNPQNCKHPYHAGDMPPLFSSAKGCAMSVFLTDRFCVGEVIGRTVIIHSQADDFTTQPSGNAGEKIACGEIKPCV